MKIKNIKKIIFMLVAFLICPAFVFSACTNNIKPVDFQVRQTNLGILDYYNKIRNTTNNFIKYIPQIEEIDFASTRPLLRHNFNNSRYWKPNLFNPSCIRLLFK